MDAQEFREAAKAAIDDIVDYLESVPSRPVVAQVEPGYLRRALPASAPLDPEPLSAIAADVRTKIVPGMTHWSSPGFMAFFPSGHSHAGALAEMWSTAFTGAHFNWVCSPAVTELETVVLDWTARALGLPECFLSGGPTRGGGVIHGTASEAVVTVMAAARERFVAARTAHLPPSGSASGSASGPGPGSAVDADADADADARDADEWRLRSRLVAVGSAGAHSSTRKAARVLGLRFAAVPVAEEHGFAMQGADLARTLDGLAARGLEPFFLTATVGTTDTCAVDDLAAVADVLAARGSDMWVHVNAAFAGSALLLDEHRPLTRPLARFHSFNFNPHKWLLVPLDCSALWVRDRRLLVDALSVKPAYLRNAFSDGELVTDYRDWQIPLGRRFRSLKLWFVLRAYGLRGLQDHVRRGIRLAEHLEARLRTRPDLFAVFTPARFALVTLRVAADSEDRINARSEALYNHVNAAGRFYLTSTVVGAKFAIRVCTATAAVRQEHVDDLFDLLVAGAQRVVQGERGQAE